MVNSQPDNLHQTELVEEGEAGSTQQGPLATALDVQERKTIGNSAQISPL